MDHGDARSSRTNIDVSTPSVARMYDYYLGGTDHYPADAEACARLSRVAPSTQALAVNNRRFLQRAVRVLAQKEGVRQFLDHGSGLPTQDNVHQVAQRVDRSCRVVYVDNDPIVLAHGRTLLEENDETAVIQADMRNTEEVFAHEETQRLLRPDEPTAALFVSVLHCVPDRDDPGGLVRRVVSHLAPGSFVVICHLVSEQAEIREETTRLMLENTGGDWGRVREPREVETFFEGLEIMDPGHLVEVSTWRPESELARSQRTDEWIEYGGIARVR